MNNKSHKLPPISDFPSRKDWQESCWKIIKSKKDIASFLTPNERNQLIVRIAVLEMLGEGKSYRAIGRELWASPQTISVIKSFIGQNSYQGYYEKSKTTRKKREYHHDTIQKKKIYEGRRVRTKYGTIHVNY